MAALSQASRATIATTAIALACCPLHAQDGASAETEQKAAYEAIRPEAQRCAGDVNCFASHVRPYGPWIVAIGGRQGEADPDFAGQVTNFAFGVVGGMAEVDPSKASATFFCGDACMRTRLSSLSRSAKKLASVAKTFDESGLDLVALWPDGRIRANDNVISGNKITYPGRTPTLGIFRGWKQGGEVKTGQVPLAKALELASMLRNAGLTAVVRDDEGGVRLVHGDSLAENEAGLLFTSASPHLGVRHRDGSRYSVVQRVASGVYVYLRV